MPMEVNTPTGLSMNDNATIASSTPVNHNAARTSEASATAFNLMDDLRVSSDSEDEMSVTSPSHINLMNDLKVSSDSEDEMSVTSPSHTTNTDSNEEMDVTFSSENQSMAQNSSSVPAYNSTVQGQSPHSQQASGMLLPADVAQVHLDYFHQSSLPFWECFWWQNCPQFGDRSWCLETWSRSKEIRRISDFYRRSYV